MRPVICIQYSFCIIENVITFPVYKQFSFCFFWLWKPYSSGLKCSGFKYCTMQTQQECYNEKNMHRIPSSKSYTTTFWSMFNTCLYSIFKVKIFVQKLSEWKKLYLLNMTTVNDNIPKKDILISRENVKLREWKAFHFQWVNLSICLSLSAGLFIFRGSFLRKSCH